MRFTLKGRLRHIQKLVELVGLDLESVLVAHASQLTTSA